MMCHLLPKLDQILHLGIPELDTLQHLFPLGVIPFSQGRILSKDCIDITKDDIAILKEGLKLFFSTLVRVVEQ